MSKCIEVTLPDGLKVMANVDDNVKSLPAEDMEALASWVASVKARQAKKNKRKAGDTRRAA